MQREDSELLKNLFHAGIHDGRQGSHLEILQTTSPIELKLGEKHLGNISDPVLVPRQSDTVLLKLFH